MNLLLLNTWLIFVLVGLTYGLSLHLGITASLWQNGIWFTENDVLHLGMIGWVYYIHKKTKNVVIDLN